MGQIQQPPGYELRQYAADAYLFTTVRGNTYTIRFIRYWQEDALSVYLDIEAEIYEIYFEIIEIKDRGYDRMIQHTIMRTILEFLSQDNRIGFFDINREDGRGLENLRVYRMWLRMYERGAEKRSTMINRIVHVPDQTDSHIACVAHSNNTLFQHRSADEMMDLVLKEIFPGAELEAF